ncbi:membrane dipeptidase [Marinicauda salina]|uniref:Membrane dipeptidase n=1 Tax=Marinicauda salina TaxID=2135793 RepID=A0A2U2BR18_9PROT|nr:dipeptidase [Marinicauda salina]PWE16445.1 membrane dipeptidase [Marinicauda salina]
MIVRTLAASAAALFAVSSAFAGETEAELESRARAIHDRVIALDTHVDIDAGYATWRLDPGGFTRAQVDLPKMRAGGLDAAFFIVYVGQGELTEEAYAEARATADEKYAAITRMIRAYPGEIGLATTADEVEAIAASGRRVALIGMENAWPLGPSVEDVPMWAERGVRYMSITHFGNNQFGGSSNPDLTRGDSPIDPGLSDLGRDLVAALNDNGIMVDISHVGPTTMREAIELSRAPVIASHSGARVLRDHPRNLDDEQLRLIRDNGGVAQMVAFRGYVGEVAPELREAQEALIAEMGLDTKEGREAASDATWTRYDARLEALREEHGDVTVADFVDHIDHAVEVAGIDHVGIASDFDGGGGVLGWDDASETLAVTVELVRRGYSEEDIAKIWGGNVLRVMRAVEAAANPDDAAGE